MYKRITQKYVAYEIMPSIKNSGSYYGKVEDWYLAPYPHKTTSGGLSGGAYIYDHPERAHPSECIMLVPTLTFEGEI